MAIEKLEKEKVREGYKETVIGVIPKHWDVMRLDDAFSITAGRDLVKDVFSPIMDKEHSFPIYSNSLENKGLYGYTKVARHKANCITITGRGTVGRANARTDKFDAIGRLLVMEPVKDLDCFFISEYINQKVKFSIESTGVPQLTVPQVSKYFVLFPPIKEQNKIASILSTVDDLIENTDHLINSYILLKKALMQTLLTKGIGHTEFRKTPLGEIPLEWEVKRLNELGNLKGGSGFKIKYQGNKECNIPFYKVSDMNLPVNNIFMKDCNNTINEQIRKKLGACLFNENTIIFAKVGAALLLNRRRILIKPSCIDNNMMGFEVINEFYKYFYYCLQLIDFGKFVNEGALPSVNQSQVGEIEVAVPPIPEQKKISNILTNIDDLIENKIYLLDSYNLLKKGLMQQLLTGKIRVKV